MENRLAACASIRGLGLGDAFGETWFPRRANASGADLAQRKVADGPWEWTDDTAMALDVLRVLAEHGYIDQDALAAAFADTYAVEPHRGYGPSMHGVLQAVGDGEPWAAVAGRQFAGQGSWGNGAAMRVAPLGAWFAADLERVGAEATRSAEITHTHPEAVAGAVAVATATALGVHGVGGDHLVEAVIDHTPDSEVRTLLRRAARILPSVDPRNAAGTLGNGARLSAVDTVPFAVWCAARHLDDLVEALWATASAGGDVDTTCAIVGGIVAARTGLAAVPTEWLAAREPLPAWVDDLERDALGTG